MSAAMVAFVGRNNELVYAAPELHSIDLMHIVWCALDVFDERQRVSAQSQSSSSEQSPYLGVLMIMEGYAAYGFLTNTGTKIIMLLELDAAEKLEAANPSSSEASSSSSPPSSMEKLFLAVYRAYVDAVSNPFLPLGASPATEPNCAFERRIRQLIVHKN